LPRPDAFSPNRASVRSVGALRIGGRCSAQGSRLRDLRGGRDQMRDKDRVRPGQPAWGLRPLRQWGHRHQRDAGGLGFREDAFLYPLLWSICIW